MTDNVARSLLHGMKRIRLVEETIAERYPEGKMRCPTHLSVGQEAVAAAAGLALRRSDVAVSGHRAHAHYLGKGGSLPRMIAEIYGKETGCARGKGGSMHLVDEEVGFMGSTAIVGGTVPVGVGLGLGLQLEGRDDVVCVFMGDAVVETGAFYESANFAAVRKLPVVFICENNLYSVYSPLSVRQPAGREIWRLASAVGLRASHHDGNDAAASFDAIATAVAEVRGGGGPAFLEFTTYRWREHCGPFYDNDIGYRTEAEFLEWRAKEPLERFQTDLLTRRMIVQQEIDAMDADIQREVDDAFVFAEDSPFPPAQQAFTHLYG